MIRDEPDYRGDDSFCSPSDLFAPDPELIMSKDPKMQKRKFDERDCARWPALAGIAIVESSDEKGPPVTHDPYTDDYDSPFFGDVLPKPGTYSSSELYRRGSAPHLLRPDLSRSSFPPPIQET